MKDSNIRSIIKLLQKLEELNREMVITVIKSNYRIQKELEKFTKDIDH